MIRDGIGSCDEGQSRVGLGLSGGRARPVVVEWLGAAAVHPRCGGGQADETPHAPKSVGVPFSPHKGICLSTHGPAVDAPMVHSSLGEFHEKLFKVDRPLKIDHWKRDFVGSAGEMLGKEDLGPVGEVGIAPGGLMGHGPLDISKGMEAPFPFSGPMDDDLAKAMTEWSRVHSGTPSEGGRDEMGPVGGAVAAGRFKRDDDEWNYGGQSKMQGRLRDGFSILRGEYAEDLHETDMYAVEEGW